jgi:hypothetical protein
MVENFFFQIIAGIEKEKTKYEKYKNFKGHNSNIQ